MQEGLLKIIVVLLSGLLGGTFTFGFILLDIKSELRDIRRKLDELD